MTPPFSTVQLAPAAANSTSCSLLTFSPVASVTALIPLDRCRKCCSSFVAAKIALTSSSSSARASESLPASTNALVFRVAPRFFFFLNLATGASAGTASAGPGSDEVEAVASLMVLSQRQSARQRNSDFLQRLGPRPFVRSQVGAGCVRARLWAKPRRAGDLGAQKALLLSGQPCLSVVKTRQRGDFNAVNELILVHCEVRSERFR
eukprot:m.457173 g.457173  ORF g.457173 m.457173 type:complete len:206 (+) comp21210_c0_seq1:4465-5082(+)